MAVAVALRETKLRGWVRLVRSALEPAMLDDKLDGHANESNIRCSVEVSSLLTDSLTHSLTHSPEEGVAEFPLAVKHAAEVVLGVCITTLRV